MGPASRPASRSSDRLVFAPIESRLDSRLAARTAVLQWGLAAPQSVLAYEYARHRHAAPETYGRDIASTIHPYTNLKTHQTDGPLVITEGHGVYVRDENGKEYLEGLAGLWCASLGFSEKRLADAAYRQMLKLPFYHTFADKAHDTGIELAEKLLSIAPAQMSKVFFVNSGSEANDTVVKLVWYYNNAIGRPKKKKIISPAEGYHGVTVASASLTGLPNNHRDFDLPIASILHIECPHWYRFAEPGESEEAFATRLPRIARNADLARRTRDRGGPHRRADHRRRRRSASAGHVLGKNPSRVAQI